LSNNVAADGTFSINGSPEHGLPRNYQRVFVVVDGQNRQIAVLRNVRFFREPRLPPAPVALTATASGNNVAIRWSPDTGWPPTGYILDAGSSPGAANIGSFSTTAPSLSAAGVPNGRYYLRVRAVNAVGTSAASAEITLTVGCLPPLPATMLAPVVSGNAITLAWQPSPTSGVSYTIAAGSTPGSNNIAQIPVGTATSLTANAPAGRYFVRVRATSPCGAAESNEVELAVGLPPVPGAPANLTHQVNGGIVTLTWQASAGTVGGYVIEAGSQSGSANLAVMQLANVLSFSAAGVSRGTYFVRVRAFNAGGQGPPSNEATVVVP
jgi:predicted phage tail protein